MSVTSFFPKASPKVTTAPHFYLKILSCSVKGSIYVMHCSMKQVGVIRKGDAVSAQGSVLQY